jgi:hypothetical protein
MKLLLLLVIDDEIVAVVVATANPEKSEAFTIKPKTTDMTAKMDSILRRNDIFIE